MEDKITKEEFKQITKRMREEWDATGKDVKIFLDNKMIINRGKNNDNKKS